MDSGTISSDDFPQVLREAGRRAWVRALLGPTRRAISPLYSAHVVIGRQPPTWHRRAWRYEACTFAAAEVTTKELAQAFDPGKPEPLTLGSLRASLALTLGVHNWRREPSRARFDDLQIPWPTVHYELQLSGLDNVRIPEFLVGRGCPSFPAAGAAFNAFFFGNYAVSGSRTPVLGRVDVRVIDQSARFVRIRTQPTTLDVWVGGRTLKGAVLELNGATRLAGRVLERLHFPPLDAAERTLGSR